MKAFSRFTFLVILLVFMMLGVSMAQQSEVTVSTVVLDSAPKKLYSELYSDTIGNQYLVEIYEEPQEGENLVHFRAFRNGELLARKSQALADSHNFSFFIDESEDRLMRPDVQEMMLQFLRRLFEESDEKQRNMLVELFRDEKMASNISKNLKLPDADVDEVQLAKLLSGRIVDDTKLVDRLSREIAQPPVQINEKKLENVMMSVLTNEEVANKISNKNKPEPAVVDVDRLALQLSGNIVPKVDEVALAEILTENVRPQVDEVALAEILTENVRPQVDEEQLAARLSGRIVDETELVNLLSENVKPVVNDAELARRISGKIRPSPIVMNEDVLAASLARRLMEKEKVAAAQIPKYAELLQQVEAANQEKDYAKTIRILDEDIARRTPDEQQRVLKISGLMSVLVASKKLKTALSTISDYDLPEDQALDMLSASLEKWIQQNLIVE